MGLFEIIVIAIGLSMDAFAAAVCKGLSVQKLSGGQAALTGLYFGGFQALMPLVGFVLGFRFEDAIKSVDHWIAFIMLAFIGVNMIRESFGSAETVEDCFCPREMLVMAVATSIDALVVGISFAFLSVNILAAAGIIGVTTYVLSAAGVYVGHFFGARFKSAAELAGGVILILIGLKVLLEHLGIISL